MACPSYADRTALAAWELPRQLPHLRELSLAHCTELVELDLAACPSLRRLCLDGCTQLTAVHTPGPLVTLEQVDMRQCGPRYGDASATAPWRRAAAHA